MLTLRNNYFRYMNNSVLIIEDEKPIADTILYALKSDGFQPEWCSTGSEGLQKLASRQFSLVVLDIGLPDTSGLEVCRRIRATSSIPILFLSARAEEIDRVVGLEIGGDDYLTKPFSPRELSARIRAILRRTESAPVQVSREVEDDDADWFRVDEEKKAVFYFNAPLELSRQEFKILTTLIAHPGRVYSREELMNAAWDEPGFSSDRTVDSHIKSIRAKLRSVNSNIDDPVETHRGFGYSLKSPKSSFA